MRRAYLIFAFGFLSACSPQGSKQDPRDRKSDMEGAVTWRVVTQSDGLAAFLARPGNAPDLVLWCRNKDEITLRAHVFEAPNANPDLQLDTRGGSMVFTNVRRQGGVRAGDRVLVEGTGALQDPKIAPLLQGADQLALKSGQEIYRAENADKDKVMLGFVAACKNL
jgi:hypothetical protein